MVLQRVFFMLAQVSFLFVMGTGGRLTADCISEERRNGTLGFLFLTRLKGHDVVLGKLAARGIPAVYSLLALFPALALMLLVGGVSAKVLFEFMMALLNALFFALATGVAMSALFRSRPASEWMTGGLLAMLFILLPVVGLILTANGVEPWATELPLFLSPIPTLEFWVQLTSLSGGGMRRSTLLGSFWASLGFTHLMAWLLLWLAGLRLARAWRETGPSRRLTWRDHVRQWRYGNAGQRLARRRDCLDRNPFFWLAARDRWATAGFWWLLGVTILELAWMALQLRWNEAIGMASLLGFFGWYFAPKFFLAASAVSTLATERREGTLELILATPLSLGDIFRGQWLALKKHHLRSVLVGLGFQLATIVWLIMVPHSAWLGEMRAFLLPLCVVCVFFYLFDLWTIGWVGMWHGLSIGDPKKAASSVTQSILFLPGAVFCFTIASVQLISFVLVRRPWTLTFEGMLALWCVLGIASNVCWLAWARAHLRREFRNVAAQPLDKPGGLGAWGRWLGEWVVRRRQSASRSP